MIICLPPTFLQIVKLLFRMIEMVISKDTFNLDNRHEISELQKLTSLFYLHFQHTSVSDSWPSKLAVSSVSVSELQQRFFEDIGGGPIILDP